jgi:zinc finger MYND domain-containing protein 11
MMPSPVVRRAAEPLMIQRLWTAITAVRSQKQVANEERIIRYIRREHGETAAQDATNQLHLAVNDGLISDYRAFVQKGSAVGTEQDAYRIPEGEIVSSGYSVKV